MPRAPPKDVVEHRLTLGTWERHAAKEMVTEQVKTGYLKAGATAGGSILGSAGLLVAGYALWRWVGLPGIKAVVEEAQSTWDDATSFVEETSGEFGKWVVSGYVDTLKAAARANNMAMKKYSRQYAEAQAIIDDPNTSDNQKAMAAEDQKRIRQAAARQRRRWNQIVRDSRSIF